MAAAPSPPTCPRLQGRCSPAARRSRVTSAAAEGTQRFRERGSWLPCDAGTAGSRPGQGWPAPLGRRRFRLRAPLPLVPRRDSGRIRWDPSGSLLRFAHCASRGSPCSDAGRWRMPSQNARGPRCVAPPRVVGKSRSGIQRRRPGRTWRRVPRLHNLETFSDESPRCRRCAVRNPAHDLLARDGTAGGYEPLSCGGLFPPVAEVATGAGC
jgi:hypothetical protein